MKILSISLGPLHKTPSILVSSFISLFPIAEFIFIIYLRSLSAPSPTSDPYGFLLAHNDASTMLGDVNFFLHPISLPSSPNPSSSPSATFSSHRAELECYPSPHLSTLPGHESHSKLSQTVHLVYVKTARDETEAFLCEYGMENEKRSRLCHKLVRKLEGVRFFRKGRSSWDSKATSGDGQQKEAREMEDPINEERD